ncbi:HK97 family phage portal protein [Nitrobacteraceae bacterium AZCC 2161]
MPALRSIASRFQKFVGLETKGSLSAPEPWLFDLFGSAPALSGVTVTPRTAMTCAPVRRAVQLISESIGQLPVHVYSRGADGTKDRAPDHPAYALLHDQANDWTPAPKFREDITRDALLYPNGGFAEIIRVDGDKPFELIRLNPELNPVIVTYIDSEPFYRVGDREIPRQNILHIPSPSLNGWGCVHDAREAIGLCIVMERHAARLFGNGARPSGLLSLKGIVTPDAITKAKAAWQATHGGSNSGGTAVIPAEANWQSLTLTSVDAQFLELRKYQIEEIARVFGVPPHMLFEMQRTIRSNAEQMGSEWITYSLMSWIKRWEGEIRLKLFSPDERKTHFAEFLTDDFARGDLATRMEAFSKAIAARIMNPNEARAADNRAPYAGGDEFINPNVQTANRLFASDPASSLSPRAEIRRLSQADPRRLHRSSFGFR